MLSFGDGSYGVFGYIDCFGGDVYEFWEINGLLEDVVSVGVGYYYFMVVV